MDWENYKKAQNEYQNGFDKAENDYTTSLTESLSSYKNSMSWWSIVKWWLGKGRDTSYPTIGVDNKDITDNEEKGKTFNEFILSHSNTDDSNDELPYHVGEENV